MLSWECPAAMLTLPPCELVAVPTPKLISPEVSVASPVDRWSVPESPSAAVPVSTNTSPVSLDVLEEIWTEPEVDSIRGEVKGLGSGW